MKIIKKGKLPKGKTYKGECLNCGCIFLCIQSEVTFVEDRDEDHPTHKCPTCNQNTYLVEE